MTKRQSWTHAASSWRKRSRRTSESGSCPSSRSSSSSPDCNLASPSAAWTRTAASLSCARASRLFRRRMYKSSLIGQHCQSRMRAIQTHLISPRPLTMDTVKSVTLNRTVLSFASMPASKCRSSLTTNLVYAVSTSSSSSVRVARSTHQPAHLSSLVCICRDEPTLLCRIGNVTSDEFHHSIRNRFTLLHTQYHIDHVDKGRIERFLP